MIRNFDDVTLPDPALPLLHRRAIFVYENTRLHAMAIDAPIIQPPWLQRDYAFRSQFLNIIAQQMGDQRSDDPEALHNSWWEAYERMGWRHGPTLDHEAKTHPDMVPFEHLGFREQIKDEVFVRLCELARTCIVEDPE